MALNYAASLSPYPNKGKCGMEEVHDSEEQVESKKKYKILQRLLKEISILNKF